MNTTIYLESILFSVASVYVLKVEMGYSLFVKPKAIMETIDTFKWIEKDCEGVGAHYYLGDIYIWQPLFTCR